MDTGRTLRSAPWCIRKSRVRLPLAAAGAGRGRGALAADVAAAGARDVEVRAGLRLRGGREAGLRGRARQHLDLALAGARFETLAGESVLGGAVGRRVVGAAVVDRARL